MPEEKEFLIFYSWQSDLPQNTNQKAIRSSLRSASSLIEESSDIRIVLDEATRGESGSPNIPATILQKISACDLFVCDLTTINSQSDESVRKTPNPNVLFELGYAVSILGWGRIVMLFNRHFGKFPDDLPFDIDRHRASPFILSEEDPKNKSNISDLQALLKVAISAVVENGPKRPSEMLMKTPEEIRRIRDIENLTWVLSAIHLPTIDQMVLDLPHYLSNRVFHFWESFRSTFENSLFYLYDKNAENLIKNIFVGWQGCVGHGEQYRMAPNPNLYVFSNPGDAPLNKTQEEAWNRIEESRSLLRSSLDQLLAHIRNEYIEIDVEELSRNAWKEYVAYEKNLLSESGN
ncbi:nucleotide-binding protein [Aeromonas taiwanensis]|uniref:nucleotide-binding protein n=1 Tax=Aeromonas taiwanensis TaxID=633417 RepID=UPI00207CE872|nr:nucleotide-binding protein [Aeromonas taiwanensis]MCO4206092.1 nucleotide-binding protein [Aeromonas taiwanensis]